ncbi:MAG: TonB family protein [Thermoanaerobaculia bacterium]|nr:TonB family protein [Thermoanaerobaculia bacterium]
MEPTRQRDPEADAPESTGAKPLGGLELQAEVDDLGPRREEIQALRREIAREAADIEIMIDNGRVEEALAALRDLEARHGQEAPTELILEHVEASANGDSRVLEMARSYRERVRRGEGDPADRERELLSATASIEDEIRRGDHDRAREALRALEEEYGDEAPVAELEARIPDAVAQASAPTDFWEQDTEERRGRAGLWIAAAIAAVALAGAGWWLARPEAASSPTVAADRPGSVAAAGGRNARAERAEEVAPSAPARTAPAAAPPEPDPVGPELAATEPPASTNGTADLPVAETTPPVEAAPTTAGPAPAPDRAVEDEELAAAEPAATEDPASDAAAEVPVQAPTAPQPQDTTPPDRTEVTEVAPEPQVVTTVATAGDDPDPAPIAPPPEPAVEDAPAAAATAADRTVPPTAEPELEPARTAANVDTPIRTAAVAAEPAAIGDLSDAPPTPLAAAVETAPPRPAAARSEPSPAPIAADPTPRAPALEPEPAATGGDGATAGEPAPTPEARPTPEPTSPRLLTCGDDGVVCARKLEVPAPEFPPQARSRRLTGTVVVRALIDESGRVVETELADATRFGPFNSAAIEAAKQARFAPASRDGVPGRSWARLTYEFGY